MEELKKDVESVKALTGQQSFLETITDMNLLRNEPILGHDDDDDSVSSQKWFKQFQITFILVPRLIIYFDFL